MDKGLAFEAEFDLFLEKVEPRLREMLDKYQIPAEDGEDVLSQTLFALIYQWERTPDPEKWIYVTLRRNCKLYWHARSDVS